MNKAVDKLLDLTGQTALVTGASGGIGAAIARRLGQAGAKIIVHYHTNRVVAEDLAVGLTAAGCQASVEQADLTSEADIDRMFERLDGAGMAPSLLVNNAAVQPVAEIADLSLGAWRQVLSVNLDGAFLLTKKLSIRAGATGARAAIVNIASVEGLDPAPAHAHYSASKAGLISFTKSAAAEFGRLGVRVNAVSPGLIERDGIEQAWPDGVARWRAKAPLARMGEGQDVADAVLFLLSDAARWITGANLIVDGGMSAASRW